MEKVFNPGAIGLTNYRHHFNRPLYGTVPLGAHSRQYALRRQPGGRYWRPVNYENYMPQPIASGVASYVGTTKRYKKPSKKYRKTCCRRIKGQKVCRPKFCRDKNKQRRKFYWY